MVFGALRNTTRGNYTRTIPVTPRKVLTEQVFEITGKNKVKVSFHYKNGCIITADKKKVELDIDQTKALKDIFVNTKYIFNQ